MEDPDYITPKEAWRVVGGNQAHQPADLLSRSRITGSNRASSRGILSVSPAPPDCSPQGAGYELEPDGGRVIHADLKCCEARHR